MKRCINIHKVINSLLAFLIFLFPVANSMEREETAAQVRSEVKRILRNFQRNMDAYYERTRNRKKISIIPTEERERRKQRIKTGEGFQEQAGRERGGHWRDKRDERGREPWQSGSEGEKAPGRERRGERGRKHWQNMSEEDRRRWQEKRREAWESMTEEERKQKRLRWEQRCRQRGDQCGKGCGRGRGEGRRCQGGK